MVWEHRLTAVPLHWAQTLRCSPDSCSGVAVALRLVTLDAEQKSEALQWCMLTARLSHDRDRQQT